MRTLALAPLPHPLVPHPGPRICTEAAKMKAHLAHFAIHARTGSSQGDGWYDVGKATCLASAGLSCLPCVLACGSKPPVPSSVHCSKPHSPGSGGVVPQHLDHNPVVLLRFIRRDPCCHLRTCSVENGQVTPHQGSTGSKGFRTFDRTEDARRSRACRAMKWRFGLRPWNE